MARGTPKPSNFHGIFYYKPSIWGTPVYGNPHIAPRKPRVIFFLCQTEIRRLHCSPPSIFHDGTKEHLRKGGI